MKKKLLTALFIVIMACLFSFTAYAANEVTLTDGTTADLETVFNITNNEIRGFNTDYTKDDITDVTFPDEIVGIEKNYLFNKAANLKTVTFAATDTFFISGDGIFSGCSVEKITFNPDCVVELRKGNFSSCKSLMEITFPKFKMLAGSAFKDCTNMVATNQLILEEGMTEIGGHAFNGCTSLTSKVIFPSTLEKIQEYSFQNTGISEFDLSKCANLTLVGGSFGGPFNDNDNLISIDMSACVSLTAISKGNLFAGCDNLEEVILPPNLTNLPEKAFSSCPKLQSLVLPASFTTIGVEAFQYARKGQENQTFTLYIQSDVYFDTSKYSVFNSSSAKVEFILIGDGVTAESFMAANDYTHVTGAAIVDYKGGENPWSYVPGQAITSHTIVENYCTTLALTGEHLSDSNPCVIICNDCGCVKAKENPEHNKAVSIVYEGGYMAGGVKATACTNEGCTFEETEETVALFVCLGYSAKENGVNGFTVGYVVDREAVATYEKTNGVSLKYGVFAVSQAKLGEKEIFGDDGKMTSGVQGVDVTVHNLDLFEIKVVGFTDEQKSLPLTVGAYVATTKDGVTKYSYMQDEEKGTLEGKYYFVSYNSITAK